MGLSIISNISLLVGEGFGTDNERWAIRQPGTGH